MAQEKPAESTQELETALAELERIVGELEKGQMGLDEGMRRFEQGVKLYQLCRRSLEAAEKKVKILTEELKEEDLE